MLQIYHLYVWMSTEKSEIFLTSGFRNRGLSIFQFLVRYLTAHELCSRIAGITEKEFLSEVKRSFIG